VPDRVTPRRGHSYISRTTPDAARLCSTHVAFSLIGRRATRHLREKDLNSPEEVGDSVRSRPRVAYRRWQTSLLAYPCNVGPAYFPARRVGQSPWALRRRGTNRSRHAGRHDHPGRRGVRSQSKARMALLVPTSPPAGAGSRQLVEKPLRFFQIGGVEALGEPAVN
jgi:hypothetical protein